MLFLHYLWYAIVFVTMISILVAAHELGHYLFARLFNMGVEEFAIGFGKPILTVWRRNKYLLPLEPGQDPMLNTVSEGSALEGGNKVVERRLVDDGTAIEETTDFTIRPWPLGGFVRIKGMMPEEDGSETRIPGGFYSKSPWKRLIVLVAGPAFSILAGILVLIPTFMIWGMQKPVNKPIIGDLSEGPAQRAGLQRNDRIVAIDGKPVSTFYDMLKIVRDAPNRPLAFHVDRQGKAIDLTVTPSYDKSPTPIVGPDLEFTPDLKRQARIFAGPKVEQANLSFGEATSMALKQPALVVAGVAGIFVKPARFSQQVSGPVTIVQVTARAVDQGIDKVLWLAAMLSISVGIMNLLPIPPLDGGQMMIALAEMLRGGRRLSLQMQNLANLVGVAMVFALMVGALTVDIKRRIDEPRIEAEIKAQQQGAK